MEQNQRLLFTVLILACFQLLAQNSLAATDLSTAIENLTTTIVSNVEGRNVVIGPVYNNQTKKLDGLGAEIIDQLQTSLANNNISSSIIPNIEGVFVQFKTANYSFKESGIANNSNLNEYDIIVIGSIDNWGNNFVVKIKSYKAKTGELTGGGTQYIERGSLPPEITTMAFDLDNPPLINQTHLASDYERSAIGVSFGRVPGLSAEFSLVIYENKIGEYSSFAGQLMLISVTGKDESSEWQENGYSFIASFRRYPFHHGQGLRGFYFGGGFGAGRIAIETLDFDWESGTFKNTAESGGLFLGVFEFGRKILFGQHVFLNLNVNIFSLKLPYENDPKIGGWVGVGLGGLW